MLLAWFASAAWATWIALTILCFTHPQLFLREPTLCLLRQRRDQSTCWRWLYHPARVSTSLTSRFAAPCERRLPVHHSRSPPSRKLAAISVAG
jgi:hypothetical protein